MIANKTVQNMTVTYFFSMTIYGNSVYVIIIMSCTRFRVNLHSVVA